MSDLFIAIWLEVSELFIAVWLEVSELFITVSYGRLEVSELFIAVSYGEGWTSFCDCIVLAGGPSERGGVSMSDHPSLVPRPSSFIRHAK